MLVLLSPAKKLDDRPVRPTIEPTRPRLMPHTVELMETARTLGKADLAKLMHLSDNLATLNHDRFQRWKKTHTAKNSLPAALTFAGDVYQGLDARSLGDEALGWTQEHVAILSGLYGVLRPLDKIQPYRLEMGTRLRTERGASLYAFWGPHIAEELNKRLRGHQDKTFVNLASNEYFGAVDRKVLRHRVLSFAFEDVKDGKARTVSFFAKRARGAMTRWIIDNRVERVESIREAVVDGYTFVPEASTTERWTYRRPQPPPVGKK